MERTPLVPIAIALALGSAIALPLNLEQRVVVAFAFTALCIFMGTRRGGTVPLRVGIVLALAWPSAAAHFHGGSSPNFNEAHTRRYTGTILSCSQSPGSGGAECSVFLEQNATVLAYFSHAPSAIGLNVVIRGRMTPFDAPRNPGEPDRRLIEAERGNAAMLEDALIIRTNGPASWSVPVLVARMHASAGERLRRYLDEPFASIVAGELWGERAAIPADLRAEFQDTGTVHVLVTAGLHLAVIAWLAAAAFEWLRIPRIPACMLTAAVIWGYVLFSGAHLPAIRAGAMISFALAARAAGAKALSWNALAAAAIAVLLALPASVLSASFAMSFSYVGAIVLLSPHIDALLARCEPLPHAVREVLNLTLATQLGVWPLTAATFLLFAPYSVLANAVTVPFVGVTMVIGALQIAFADVMPLAHAFANLNAWLLNWMVGTVRLTSNLPHAHIVMTPAPLWAIGCYDIALFAAVWMYEQRALTAAAAIIICAVGLVIAPPRHIDQTLQITMLDVGQADAIVIRTPRGQVLLVDAGGRLERGAQTAADSAAERVGENVVVPFLIRNGIHHLDALLLSHPHGEHKTFCSHKRASGRIKS